MKHDSEDDITGILSNRQKTLLPRKTKFYCACDMAMVAPWKKCKVCGQRNGKKRLKK